ncbi:MAG: protein kinase domain-containing protein, partial [Adlercreutzia equolifaciens]
VVVMEYIQGRTLRDEVYERDGSLALAAQWFPLLCDGVMELHEQFSPPLIHRDLKPTNIVVSDAGLTIIDFGIARVFREGADGDTAHFGTRATRRPSSSATGRLTSYDVYALGMPLYTCWPSAIRRRRWLRRDSRGRKCLSRCAPCSSAPAPLIRRPASRRCAT